MLTQAEGLLVLSVILTLVGKEVGRAVATTVTVLFDCDEQGKGTQHSGGDEHGCISQAKGKWGKNAQPSLAGLKLYNFKPMPCGTKVLNIRNRKIL